MPFTIPGESAAYRAARDELLAAEVALRAEVERVAALRRALPEGAAPRAEYRFTGTGGETTLQDLFAPGKPDLYLYNFMFAPAEGKGACPMCCAYLESLNGAAPHIGAVMNLAVLAKAPARDLAEIGAARGWTNLRLLSTAGTTWNADYGAETAEGGQLPMAHSWRMTEAGPRHVWSSEMFFHEGDWDQHPRHVDMSWPLWNVMDTTTAGRPAGWFPALDYT